MSGSYHWVAMRNYLAFYEVALQNGFGRIFSGRYRQRLTDAAYAELYQEKPDFSVPITNDSNSSINRKNQLQHIEAILKIPEITWRLTGGLHGQRPASTSYFLNEARMGFMRSGWRHRALYLSFDMGRWGDNHMNEDQLAVEVSAFGRNFLVNSGRWRYTTSDPSASWMRWAKYFKDTESYNSLLVDGYSQMPGDAMGRMWIHDEYDYADGYFSAGWGEDMEATNEEILSTNGITGSKKLRVTGTHRREVFFVKPAAFYLSGFWIIRDTVSFFDEEKHAIETIWHGLEGEFLELENGRWRTDFQDANLFLLCFELIANERESDSFILKTPAVQRYFKGSEKPIAGWHCPYYDIKVPAPELRFQVEGKKKLMLVTLLLPVEGIPSNSPTFTVGCETYEITYCGLKTIVYAPKQETWRFYLERFKEGT